MMLNKSMFIGPKQALTVNNVVINVVNSLEMLGVIIEKRLSWNPSHLERTIKSFAKKPEILGSIGFYPPTNSLVQFYFKVILPSRTNGATAVRPSSDRRIKQIADKRREGLPRLALLKYEWKTPQQHKLAATVSELQIQTCHLRTPKHILRKQCNW